MKKERGITLVALVITIIVLLILAGVTIAQATSGTGIFSHAKNAANAYNTSAAEENAALQSWNQELENDFKTYGPQD